jgi:hypothetical protein
MMLYLNRIVKGALSGENVLKLPGQLRLFQKPLKRAAELVIHFDCFGAYPGVAFELLSRHEAVEQGN